MEVMTNVLNTRFEFRVCIKGNIIINDINKYRLIDYNHYGGLLKIDN